MAKNNSRYKTIARIEVPLSETSDFEFNPKTKAFINLIVCKNKDPKGGYRILSHLRINVRLEDGTILKGPIKKYAWKRMFDLFPLTAKELDKHRSRFSIVDVEIYMALKKRFKIESEKIKKKIGKK